MIAEEQKFRTGHLDLGMLGLTELPSELGALTELTVLFLGPREFDVQRFCWVAGIRHNMQENAITDLSPLARLTSPNKSPECLTIQPVPC